MIHVLIKRPALLRMAAVGAAMAQACLAQCSLSWDTRFGVQGIDGWVYSGTTFDDGAGPALYLGGAFAVAETTSGGNVAKRAGAQWVAPGGGIPSTQLPFAQTNQPVTSFATFDDGTGAQLYAARQLVYRFNGSSWTSLTSATSGINPGSVNGILVHDDGTGNLLYAAGGFFRPGGTFTGVARWTGTDWLQVGGDFTVSGGFSELHSLAQFTDQIGQTNLYAAGRFNLIGGVAANSIARWTGTSWTALAGGIASDSSGTVPGRVDDLHVWNDGGGDQLYACGTFTQAGPGSALNLARWNGLAWSSIGDVQAGNVFSLGSMVLAGVPTLFVGGDNIWMAGGVPVVNIAAYNGAWSNPGGGITSSSGAGATKIWMLHPFDDGTGEKLYVGGRFDRPGGQPNGENVTTWNGTSWAAVNSAGTLWGGEFFVLNPTSGASPFIQAACVYDDGSGPALYAAGYFNRIGGVAVNHIAKFNGQTWQALGTGLNGPATSLAVFDDGTGAKLYIGGSFGIANGVQASRLVRWNGTSFSAVPGWVSGQNVGALAVFDDGSGPALWVGRHCPFCTTPPGQSLALMKWTPTGFVAFASTIAPVHPSFPVIIYSLEVLDWGLGPRLVVGGYFSSVGGVPCSGIFAWNGASVDPLGGGFGPLGGTFPSVSASTVFTGPSLVPRLVAGGVFGSAVATGQPRRCIAQWDGTQWGPLGTGVDMLIDLGPEVLALHPFRDGLFESLYAGGRFLDAGGVAVSNLARWDGVAWSNAGGGVRFVGKAIRAWVSDFVDADLGNGRALVATGAFNTAGANVGAGLLAAWTPSRPSITLSQPFAGGPVSIQESNLVAGHEYYSLFSLEPCGGGPGSGPYVGLCASNVQFLIDQVSLPIGAVPFHFVAGGSTAAFGPYGGLPPITIDALVFELTGFLIGCPSLITRFAIQ